jgi:ubiquinone/menaquinone biosynthesis C-methylase UbiE
MNEQQAIRDEQKKTWDKASRGWMKWNDFTMSLLKPIGDLIIKALDVKINDLVLDVASGTGEPAFSIATLAKNGKVYATDLSEAMLTVARTYAGERNITNIEFKVADVSNIPFKDNFFDKISCRMGFMFFPDMQMAANEMYRVCRSGGKVAISVWAAPEDNDWYTTFMNVLSHHIEVSKPPPGAPGVFRCAKPGLMKQLFEHAGFKKAKEENISGTIDFKTAENYWLNRTEISEQIIKLLSKVDESTRNKIKDELLAYCSSKLINGKLIMNYATIIISAEK